MSLLVDLPPFILFRKLVKWVIFRFSLGIYFFDHLWLSQLFQMVKINYKVSYLEYF
jgi:hypothetical protein